MKIINNAKMNIQKSTKGMLWYATVLLLFNVIGCNSESESKATEAEMLTAVTNSVENNTLTKEEEEAGWKLLFDGESFDGWRSLGRETIPKNLWKIENGTIHKVNTGDVASLPDGQPAEGGDLITNEQFTDYELYFEWRVEPSGNTGLKYNVSEEVSLKNGVSALGFEYQLGDDSNFINERKPTHLVGALYDLFPTKHKVEINPIDEFNRSRLLVQGNHVEHWLNGEKVLEYELGSKELDSAYRVSKYNKIPDFHKKKRAHLVLQNHKDAAWFRNIKIREIKGEGKVL